MSRTTLATIAAVAAALTFTSSAHAASQTQTIPGVGTVTVSEPKLDYVPSPYVYVTLTADGSVTSTDFQPIVFLSTSPERGATRVLRAHGTGTGVDAASYGAVTSTPDCQWISNSSNQGDPVETSVSADGRSVTFAIGRFDFPQPVRFRWLAIDGRPSQLGTACVPDPMFPFDTGVARNLLSDPQSLEFVGLTDWSGPALLAAPAVTATAIAGGVKLCWSAVPGANVVYRVAVGDHLRIVDGTSYTATGLTGGRRYTAEAQAMTEQTRALLLLSETGYAEFTAKPSLDSDGDGIRNDWTIDGRGAPAPKRPRAAKVTAASVTLTLPRAPKGARLRIYGKAGSGAYKLMATTTKRTVKVGAKASTVYRYKVVAVNAKGKQSAASKPITVKTRKKR